MKLRSAYFEELRRTIPFNLLLLSQSKLKILNNLPKYICFKSLLKNQHWQYNLVTRRLYLPLLHFTPLINFNPQSVRILFFFESGINFLIALNNEIIVFNKMVCLLHNFKDIFKWWYILIDNSWRFSKRAL